MNLNFHDLIGLAIAGFFLCYILSIAISGLLDIFFRLARYD